MSELKNTLSRPLTSGRARLLLGDDEGRPIPASTWAWWVRRGAITPVVHASQGENTVVTVQQTWALATAKAIRKAGQPMEAACQVAALLESLTADDIEQSFIEGRTCAFVVTIGDETNVLPLLIQPEAVSSNPMLVELRAQAEQDGLTTQYYGVDVRPMLNQLVGHVLNERKKLRKKRRK